MNILSPIIKQYLNIKSKYLDVLLFFQVGDFYELFYDDAKKISSLLNITLTKKKFVKQESVFMAGVPVSKHTNYVARLISLGESVAICDQVLDKSHCNNKNLIKRIVTRVITPGTVIEDKYLDSGKDNLIICVWQDIYCKTNKIIGCSILNVTLGLFYVVEFNNLDDLKSELLRIKPAEILCSNSFKSIVFMQYFTCVKYISEYEFDYSKNYRILLDYFGVSNLSCFGIEDKKSVIRTSGFLIDYLKYVCLISLPHINKIEYLDNKKHLFFSYFAIKSLEIFKSISGDKKKSLFYVLDHTVTYMGKRMLKRWLINPVNDFSEINRRHNIMEFIKHDVKYVINFLKKLKDIERILSRIAFKKADSNDLCFFKDYLILVKDFSSFFFKRRNLYIFDYIIANYDVLDKLLYLINKYMDFSVDNLGKYNISLGCNKKLDVLRDLNSENIFFLNELQNIERFKTKIKNLVIKYNRIYGYYVQINKSNVKLVPSYYIKIRTLKHTVKYIFPKLKEHEIKILSIKKKLLILEKKIFHKVLDNIILDLRIFKIINNYLAELDVLSNFLKISSSFNYVKPVLVNSSYIKILKCRHPVIDNDSFFNFIPNDFCFNKKIRILIITGPNMGGKSTYMRQIMLIVIMTYIGCYVPAQECVVGYFDKILTRIGFSDDITLNKSTFMVEMNEVAYILNNATCNSLVLIDEFGRGTSVNEGISLAWACLIYISTHIKSLTLFSTHYLELTKLEKIRHNIKNIYLDFLSGKNMILLYTVKQGICKKSYAFLTARVSGISDKILNISKKKLDEFNLVHKQKSCVELKNKCFKKKHVLLVNNLKEIKVNNLSCNEIIRKIIFLKKLVK